MSEESGEVFDAIVSFAVLALQGENYYITVEPRKGLVIMTERMRFQLLLHWIAADYCRRSASRRSFIYDTHLSDRSGTSSFLLVVAAWRLESAGLLIDRGIGPYINLAGNSKVTIKEFCSRTILISLHDEVEVE